MLALRNPYSSFRGVTTDDTDIVCRNLDLLDPSFAYPVLVRWKKGPTALLVTTERRVEPPLVGWVLVDRDSRHGNKYGHRGPDQGVQVL